MTTVAERVSVVEVQVVNLDEKIDEIKHDVHALRGSIDHSYNSIQEQLTQMQIASSAQHGAINDKICEVHDELTEKIKELENFKNKWIYILSGAVAVLGWVSGHTDIINKIFQ